MSETFMCVDLTWFMIEVKNNVCGVFQQHIDLAIKLQPEDPSSHYLKGRWCYGVRIFT